MRKINAYGPSLIVLATVGIVLVAGPSAVRQLTYERTEARRVQSISNLAANNVLELYNQAQRDIASIVEPSVVYITTQRLIEDFRFGSRQTIALSSGSGWVYDEEGHIITNAHVIEGANRIEVQLQEGPPHEAVLVGADPETDIAVIKIMPGNLHPAIRGSSGDVRQGDMVFAFGSPFDFRFSMSSGIVSGLRRSADLERVEYENFIQVDAAINPGNSGGPLTNVRGEVIGMNTAIATGRRGSTDEGVFAGIGLAIPIDMIEAVVKQLIKHQQVVKSVMGVSLPLDDDQNERLLRFVGYTGRGVVVQRVHADSPAQLAGIETWDVITAVDGEPIVRVDQLRAIISSRGPDEAIRVMISRNHEREQAEEFEVGMKLTRRDALNEIHLQVEWLLHEQFGFQQIATVTRENIREFGVEFNPGVLVRRVRPSSPISNLIEPGSIIVRVNNQPVADVSGLFDEILEQGYRRLAVDVVTPKGQIKTIRLGR